MREETEGTVWTRLLLGSGRGMDEGGRGDRPGIGLSDKVVGRGDGRDIGLGEEGGEGI
jgi:hypothetical protein